MILATIHIRNARSALNRPLITCRRNSLSPPFRYIRLTIIEDDCWGDWLSDSSQIEILGFLRRRKQKAEQKRLKPRKIQIIHVGK
jgi:hypothetical protein